jgi:hypothetical protein
VEITWQLITILGGTQVVLAALFGFLAKIWTDRISNDHKAELTRIRDDQNAALTQLRDDQNAAFESQLTVLKHEQTRDRAATATERERVVTHLEKSLSAYAELLVLIRLANRHYWLFSQELVDLERASIKAFYGLSIQLQILRSIEAVPVEITSAASKALNRVHDAWDELIFRLGQYKVDLDQDSPADAKHSWTKVSDAAKVLHERTSPLEECMEAIPAAVRIPR